MMERDWGPLPPPLTNWTDEDIERAQEEWLESARDRLEKLQREARERKQSKQPQNTEILDINRAAAHLGVSAKWLYRNYRDLPHVLIPAGKRPRIKFRRADLDEWLTRHVVDWRKS